MGRDPRHSGQLGLPPDGTLPRQNDNPIFPPIAAPPGGLERGTILHVDARRHSYRVQLNSGRILVMGRFRRDRHDSTLLLQGDNVAVSFALGVPYIIAVLPLETLLADDGVGDSLTGAEDHGSRDAVLDAGHSVNGRNPTDPTDILPGDALLRAPDGATVAALRGQHAMLRGGPLAAVEAFGRGDLVKIIAGLLETFTWMGYSKVINENGKTSFIWRGGADQLTQTGPDEECFTLRLDLGHTGDLCRFEVTDREGRAVFRLHVSPRGHLEIFAADGATYTHGNAASSSFDTTHHGHARQEITQDLTVHVGGQYVVRSERGAQLGTATLLELIAGTQLNAIATDTFSAQSGGQMLLSAASALSLRGAGITLTPTAGTTLSLNTSTPGGVVCGTGATNSGVLFEPLQTELERLSNQVNTLSRAFALHAHSVSAPTIPTNASYAVPTIYNWPSARASVLRLR